MFTFVHAYCTQCSQVCVVKWSKSRLRCGQVVKQQNDSQNFLTPVAAVTTAPMGVTTSCFFPKNSKSASCEMTSDTFLIHGKLKGKSLLNMPYIRGGALTSNRCYAAILIGDIDGF